MLARKLNHALVFHGTGRNKQHRGRTVIGRDLPHQRVARERAHALLAAKDRTAQRLGRKRPALEMIENHVIRRVLGLADLLDDHALLALEFLEIKRRVLEDVGEDIDGKRHVIAQHPRVVRGLLARRIGIDEATDTLDLLGDAARGPALRALERHVLEHVGDAVGVLGLVARARTHPDADGRRLQMRHLVGDDGQTILKPGNGRGQALDLSVRVALT